MLMNYAISYKYFPGNEISVCFIHIVRSVVSTDQWLDHIGIYTPTPTKHQQGRKKLKTAYSQQNVSQCGENFYEIAVETSNFCGNYLYIRYGRVVADNIAYSKSEAVL